MVYLHQTTKCTLMKIFLSQRYLAENDSTQNISSQHEISFLCEIGKMFNRLLSCFIYKKFSSLALIRVSGVEITNGPVVWGRNNQWSGVPWPAENEQDTHKSDRRWSCSHFVQTIYFVGSMWKDHLNISRTIWIPVTLVSGLPSNLVLFLPLGVHDVWPKGVHDV